MKVYYQSKNLIEVLDLPRYLTINQVNSEWSPQVSSSVKTAFEVSSMHLEMKEVAR